MTAPADSMPDQTPVPQAASEPRKATTYVVSVHDWSTFKHVDRRVFDELVDAAAYARRSAAHHTNNEAVVRASDGQLIATVKFGMWLAARVVAALDADTEARR